jgi:hypothetical protein
MSDEVQTWCAQCGWDVDVDEDGCCATCGADATGPGVDAIHRIIAHLGALVDAAREYVSCDLHSTEYWGAEARALYEQCCHARGLYVPGEDPMADSYAAGHAAGFADALVLGALSVTCWECGDPICAESTRCAHCTWCDSPGAEE